MAEEERGNTLNRSLQWVSHPLVERPLVSAIVVLFIVFLFIMVWIVFKGWWWSVLALFFLLTSLAQYFFPTRYELDEDGITVHFLLTKKRRSWSEFRSFYKSARGVVLSPFLKPSRLDTYRGIHILCRNNRDEVIEFVSTKLKKV
ncbi:hypothetical protein J7M23_02300 [Candidatus Sumerlaeota bacterium]|nr:hypothetical protein [Candidatus Sumerlaeota bacterium]